MTAPSPNNPARNRRFMTRDDCYEETAALVREIDKIEYRIICLKSQEIDDNEHVEQYAVALSGISRASRSLENVADAIMRNKQSEEATEKVDATLAYHITLGGIRTIIPGVIHTAQDLCEYHDTVINDLQPRRSYVAQKWKVWNPWEACYYHPKTVFDLRDCNNFDIHLTT